MFELPLQHPVMVFALSMTLFLLTPMLMKRMRIPGLIGPILAGIIMGPHGFAVLARDQTVELLGTVGLLFIIFIAGLEMDIDGFKKYKNRSIFFGLLSFIFPLLIGTGIGLGLDYSLSASILLGSILGSHTLLGYPIASRLGVSKNKAVTTAVGGTLVTDTLALITLAIITGAATGHLSLGFVLSLFLSLALFVLAITLGAPLITRWFFRNMSPDGSTLFTFIIVILFFSAFLAMVAGVQPIIGAFLAGLTLNRLVFDQGPLMNRIRFTANALFIPFFLLSVGMLMDLSVLIGNPRAWILTVFIVGGVILGKYLASWVVYKFYNYNRDELHITFGLTIPQAAATLAATLVGFNVGLLDQATVNAVIIKILVTCIVGPYFVEKYGRKISLLEEQTPYVQRDAPERIMLPMTKPKAMEMLFDLAFVLRQQNKQDQPLYPLTVVNNETNTLDGEIENAEKLLGHAMQYASGADIPIKLLTRVDPNIANGMVRAVIEERISMVIAGWNAKQTRSHCTFGSVLDRFVDRTTQAILIAKLDQPLNTTKRIVAVFPRGMDHAYGFREALHRIQGMSTAIGSTLHCLIMDEDENGFLNYLLESHHQPPTTVARIFGWKTLYATYLSTPHPDDLIVILSARAGTVAWHPELEVLPGKLARRKLQNFIIYYPTEEKETDMRGTSGTGLPKEVLLRRDFYT
ncbi:cation:proton antiporter [Ammoniphilus sp. CFH 90114]|uniref:cation:proton antiporter n=1 Tax=Ammoniphilus sp. CFH 90114 TaxID=2493665 RepID=UPI00100FBBEC|nr:cation:proton antiporter [Ammoniphilus sp. CFH 90114]RXT15481.1 cation:proton antiporter [Ammoniphilus sp. CFH 90114]